MWRDARLQPEDNNLHIVLLSNSELELGVYVDNKWIYRGLNNKTVIAYNDDDLSYMLSLRRSLLNK